MLLPLSDDPKTMILPLPSIATLEAVASLLPKSVVSMPSVLKLVSSVPSELYRATAKSVRLALNEVPATTILPLPSIATLEATPPLLPKSVISLPSVSKLVSSVPSTLYRATANSGLLPLREAPAMTILLLPSISMLLAKSSLPPKSVVSLPSVSKLMSSVPSALYRATAKSELMPLNEFPATTILPLPSIATLLAESLLLPKSVVSLPSVSKLVSSVPSALNLATAKSSSLPLREDPTTTIWPLPSIATLLAKS